MLSRLDCFWARIPTSVDIAVTTPVRLVFVSATNDAKLGSLAWAVVSDATVASARIRSRMYEPVVDVPVDTALVLALASSPIVCDSPSPVETDGNARLAAGCDI